MFNNVMKKVGKTNALENQPVSTWIDTGWDGYSSGGTAGHLRIRRLVVWSLVPTVCMLNVLGEDTNPKLLSNALIRVWTLLFVRLFPSFPCLKMAVLIFVKESLSWLTEWSHCQLVACSLWMWLFRMVSDYLELNRYSKSTLYQVPPL